MRKKVTVVGSGNVGASCAVRLAEKELADIYVVDILEGIPQGKALDIHESGPVAGVDVRIVGGTEYGPTASSDIVIITAGIAPQPDMTRDDLLWANYEIVKHTVQESIRYSPNAILIVVTNPLDAMCHVALEISGFPRNRVIGMAGVLDSARFRTFVADELKVSVEDVSALVLGSHGETMVPLARYTTIAGIPLPDLLGEDAIARIIRRTREGAAEIVRNLRSGSAYYAPGAAAVEMAESILKDKKRVLACSVCLEGEYGIRDLFVGVPVKLGEQGVEKIFEVTLTEAEKAQLERSAASMQAVVDLMMPKLVESRAVR